ncbi:MAG: hypothetical protein V3V62_10380 [bacterium]
MLTVTEGALAAMAQKLVEDESPEGAVVRFHLEGETLQVNVDAEKPGDAKFAHEGKTVLVIDGELLKLLEGKTLDVRDTDEGPQLAFR